MDNLHLSKKDFYHQLSRFPNKHTAINIDMPVNWVIGKRFRLHFYWRNKSANGSFDPIMSAQLLDLEKHGPKTYVVPDLIFDCIEERISTDYRLYKRLDKWIHDSLENYISEEVAK